MKKLWTDSPGDRALFLQKRGVTGMAASRLLCVSWRERQLLCSSAFPARPGTGGTTVEPSSAAASALMRDLP